MRYELQLMDTISGVGCFGALPGPNLSFNEALAHLQARPFDEYMHHKLLTGMAEMPARKIKQLIKEYDGEERSEDHVLGSLLYETCLVHSRYQALMPKVAHWNLDVLMAHTPAIHIRASLLKDQPLHRQWTSLFAANAYDLKPLPAPDAAGLDSPFSDEEPALPEPVPAAKIRADLEGTLPAPLARRPLAETIDNALTRLEAAGAFAMPEAAHKAGLTPFARLRHWLMKISVKNGRHSNTLEGLQTCYGRGMSEEEARASYLMECAERYSSYASVGAKGLSGTLNPAPLKHGSFADISATDTALDPAQVRLEVPYAGQELYWLEGHTPTDDGVEPAWVPAQFIHLFCNLDEPSLFSALGSTGLASGNTMEEAKVAALCEVLERDADAVLPMDPARWFTLSVSDDQQIVKLLEAYEESGIHIFFQDMTTEFGVPTYKSIVVGERGDVSQGMGCGLDGRRALLSAMTETPYPFPGPATRPVPEGLPVRELETLPNLSTGSAEGDRMVLERTLLAGGYRPYFMELTRKDLQIPVVRAIVPGLEIISDYDQYTRLSPRLMANYRAMFRG